MNIKIGALILFFSFLTVGILTLPHYGINWDTINHLTRGQVYLNFFLTGKKDFSDLPDWQNYYQKPESLGIDADKPKEQVQRRSLYEGTGATFDWFVSHESGGHPVVSDILSSAFNQIFFKHLGLINDIDAYRIYGIGLAASLIGLIFWWVSKLYGKFAGFIATISLATYPLFWAEAHFNNEKDIPETVYWWFLLVSVWKAIVGKSWKWGLVSGLFFGLALGTKFNILFVGFVLLPWIFIYLFQKTKSEKTSFIKLLISYKKIFFSFLAAIIIGILIFFGSWPYLWVDPVSNIESVIKYYKTIGLTSNINYNFVGPFGINTYPSQWVIFTTPLLILFLSFLGIIYSLFSLRKSKDKIEILFLLGLLVPLLRVTLPGATIYGGIRQIMEYVPALAIFSGIGASLLLKIISLKIRYKFLISLVLIVLFIPHVMKLISIHPAENVYFNSFIGGLKGAKEKNFPAWGNSFGGPYRVGVEWINKNAQAGAKVALARELMPNVPRIWFRSDLTVSNGYRSGYLKRGEYIIGLVYEGTKDYSYMDSYLENFLVPVYQVKVDDVAVLKVWQNDRAYAKPDWVEEINSQASVQKLDTGLRFDLGQVQKLSRLEIEYSEENCKPLKSSITRLSPDGKNWDQLVGTLPNYWRISAIGSQPADGKFVEPFAGQEDRYIDFIISPFDACLKNIKSFKVYYFI